MTGPWSPWKTFAKVGSNTYDSQITFILPIGSDTLYLGDRWEFPPLLRSTYVWLPLQINGTEVTMDDVQSFVLDQGNREARINLTTMALAPLGSVDHEHKMDESQEVLANFDFETRTKTRGTTLAFEYTTKGDKEQSALVVLDGFNQEIAFLPSPSPEKVATSVVHIKANIPRGKHVVMVVGSCGQRASLCVKGLIVADV